MSHAIPKASIDSLDEVLAGYNKTTEAGELIDDDEVADVRDLTKDVAKRQKKFFAEFGVLEKDGRNYRLTEEGDTLGKYIRFNQMEDAAVAVAKFLDEWEPTAEILAHLGNEGLTKGELVDKIALVTANDITNWRKEAGVSALIAMLERAELIGTEDDKYYQNEGSQSSSGDALAASAGQSETEAIEQPEPVAEPTVSEVPVTQPGSTQVQTSGLNISLDISGSDDPENVRQLLLAIRHGVEANLDEYMENGQ